MAKHTYYKGWQRILERAGVPPIGTHGIPHRSAMDIANSGSPVKVAYAKCMRFSECRENESNLA